MVKWIIVFRLGTKESAEKLIEFFKQRLHSAYVYRQELGSVIIENPKDKDNAWKTAIWVRNNSCLRPQFVIKGFDDNGNLVFTSMCPMCLAGSDKPHHQHIKELELGKENG